MKTILLLTLILSSCATPVNLTYTSPRTGITYSESVGDGEFKLKIDASKAVIPIKGLKVEASK